MLAVGGLLAVLVAVLAVVALAGSGSSGTSPRHRVSPGSVVAGAGVAQAGMRALPVVRRGPEWAGAPRACRPGQTGGRAVWVSGRRVPELGRRRFRS